jgi:hypothetical protein
MNLDVCPNPGANRPAERTLRVNLRDRGDPVGGGQGASVGRHMSPDIDRSFVNG